MSSQLHQLPTEDGISGATHAILTDPVALIKYHHFLMQQMQNDNSVVLMHIKFPKAFNVFFFLKLMDEGEIR